MSFDFPEQWPEHEAEFTTPAKGTFVDGRVVGVRRGSDNRDNPTIDLALVVCKDQKALREGDTSESDVGGELILSRGSLNGGAAPITMERLKFFGNHPDAARLAYKADVKFLSQCHQLKSMADDKGNVAVNGKTMSLLEAQQEVATGLALIRGDTAALGLAKVARCVVVDDSFTKGAGTRNEETVVTRKLKYVNPIPTAAVEDDAMKMLGLLGGKKAAPAPAKAGGAVTQPARGATSAPPEGGELDF